jgi:mRNA interferase RelE/StbE
LSFKIVFKKSVYKDLQRLSTEEARNILDAIDTELVDNANKFPVLKGKFRGMRRFRMGNYRVIFVIIEEQVLVLRISHRKDVYR